MQHHRHPVVLVAPGAGLGHLVRASALALGLEARGCCATVITNSVYAQGLSRLLGIEVCSVPTRSWHEQTPACARSLRPSLVVLDTFPFGFRGEWQGEALARLRFAYLARRLKIDAYRQVVPGGWPPETATVARTLVIEPLSDDHRQFLDQGAQRQVALPGRIRFPHEILDTPAPPELERMLTDAPLDLVVHSGPQHEVEQLLSIARDAGADIPGAETAVIAPKPLPDIGVPCYEYFPAASLFDRAHRVVTGGGYNAVAETAALGDKHLAVPFPRRYDDQQARLRTPPMPATNGTETAVETILQWR